MEPSEIEKVRDFFEPLIQNFDEELQSIMLIGSAVRKERVEGSDIDILVIADDHSEEFDKEDERQINRTIKKIEKEAAEEGYDFHIQPVKTVSSWYSLLLRGKPWAITSMIYSQPIYDPEDFQDTVQRMISESEPKSLERRSEKLETQAEEHLENADLKLRKAAEEIVKNLDRSAKALIKFHKDSDTSEGEIADELKNITGEEKIDLEEFNRLRKKGEKIAEEGREPSFEELENLSEEAVQQIKRFQQQFHDDVNQFRKRLLDQTLEELEENCKMLLENQDIEYSPDEVFEKFQKEIIEKNILSEEHGELIEATLSMREKDVIGEEEAYQQIAGLRELETAINNIVDKDVFQTFELQSDTEEAHITPINEYEKLLLEKFEPAIEGVYVVSAENLLEAEAATLVLVIDEVEKSREKEVRELTEELETKIGEEHGFNIHTDIRRLAGYWAKLQDGNEEVIYELKSSLVSYDPNGLLESTKTLIEQGEIPGTIPKIKGEIVESTLKTVMPVKKVKEQCLSQYYNASIKIGQAKLLKEGITPPVQKKVPETLEEELLQKGETQEEEIETIEKTIKLFKNREYGKEDEISTEELEDIRNKLRNYLPD